MTHNGIPWLTLLILGPSLGALLIAFLPKEQRDLHRNVALVVSLLMFALSLPLLFAFDSGWGEFQLTHEKLENLSWISSLGIRYYVGVDGISLFLVLLTTILTPICILSTYKAVNHRVKEYMIALLVLETGMIGALVSLDLFLFYVFWEVMLIPMYLIIGVWGGKERVKAAVKFFIFTMVGSVLMLAALLYVYYHIPAGPDHSFSVQNAWAAAQGLSAGEQAWLFAAFALAFAIKVPLFPFHTWLPDAHVQAPTAGSVILAGVLLKMGTFGLIRYAIPMFPQAAIKYGAYIAVLAVIGIIFGALMAMIQKDVKGLVAYSSISHLGFVVLGLFALNSQGITGGVYQMLAHGVSTGGLFLAVGFLYERRHKRGIEDFGGVAKQLPVFSTFFVIIMLASVGLPGLCGFVGEYLVLFGTAQSDTLHFGVTGWGGQHGPELTALLFAGVAATGVILAAVYLLRVTQKVFFGPLEKPEVKSLKDTSWRELTYFAPIILLAFVLGLFPNYFIDKMEPSISRVTVLMEQQYEIYLAENGGELDSHGEDREHHEEEAPPQDEPEPEVDPHEGHDHGTLIDDGSGLFPEEVAMALRQQRQVEVNR